MTKKATVIHDLNLKTYKLKELAEVEGIHYQTVLKRHEQKKYLQVVIRTGNGKNRPIRSQVRYLDLETSELLRPILESKEATNDKAN